MVADCAKRFGITLKLTKPLVPQLNVPALIAAQAARTPTR
jgi:hypothetical protein